MLYVTSSMHGVAGLVLVNRASIETIHNPTEWFSQAQERHNATIFISIFEDLIKVFAELLNCEIKIADSRSAYQPGDEILVGCFKGWLPGKCSEDGLKIPMVDWTSVKIN